MATATYAGGYNYDNDSEQRLSSEGYVEVYRNVVGPEESKYNATLLIPSVVRLGAGLIETFCKDVNCGGPTPPSASNSNAHNDHGDDTFDVASRLIELEQLDPTKELWKDIYGRTGIKKGYIGLFLEKELSKAYQQLATAKIDAEFNQYSVVFQSVLNHAQAASKHSFEETYYASPDVAVLSNGFVDESADLLLKKIQEPVREINDSFNTKALPAQPVLFIPSGGFMGLTDSAFFKSTLDEYVKSGGTLIVLAQQNGSDFSVIPTPDGKPLAAYGWTEDQSCLWNGTYVDTYHQMMSAISTASVSAGVDGYFASYPENSTILLRRTVGGQPAMLMYEHGQGRVIVNSFYSDWGAAHAQATKEEIAIIRDMISWAKKPAKLPEIKTGETVALPVTVTNSTATDAASIKLQIFNPDRTTLLSEQVVALPVTAGQSATSDATWQSTATSQLGIYHIDYLLLDATGNVIQPQAETDSGRFVVSNPPTAAVSKPLTFKVNAPTEKFAQGSNATFTWHVWNNTDTDRTVTVKYGFPHHTWDTGDQSYGNFNGLSKTINVPAKGEATFDHTIVVRTEDQLFSYLYDENNNQIGQSNFKIWRIFPSVNIGIQTDKTLYIKGDTVNLTLNLQNKQSVATVTNVTIRVSDPINLAVYATTLNPTLAANESKTQTLSFVLPATASGGSYTISAEAFDAANNKIGGNSATFALPLSQISIIPTLPAALAPGVNTVSFALNNTGKVAVNSGAFDVTLKDPDGVIVTTASQSFALDVGQNRSIDVPLTLPPLKFGTYTLSHVQSDETRNGQPAVLSLSSFTSINASFDKLSYRIRETANLAITLANSGKFNLDSVGVTVATPDAGYSITETVNLSANHSLTLSRPIPLPDTMAVGQHAVTVMLTLPGGSNTSKTFNIIIPEPILSLSQTQNTYTAGDTINPVLTNGGGIDTQVQYKISLYDAKAALIVEKAITETVPAGGALPLSLQIPVGAMDGGYTLVTTYKDMKTGKTGLVQKTLTITGVKTVLTVRTDKETYLTTEGISGLSGVTNSGTQLQGGNLHLQVTTTAGSQKQKTWTTQADFQTGVRNGVDTYGVNDWIIPDDDFSGTTLDLNKWRTYGVVRVESGKVVTDSTNEESAVLTKYLLDGDFDIQVDFDLNNSASWEGAGFAVRASNGAFSIGVSNSRGGYYSSQTAINDIGRLEKDYLGVYAYSGRFRLTRTATTIVSYYWSGSSWVEVLRDTSDQFVGPCYAFMSVYRGLGLAASAAYDNFKVNSGRIKTENQTVDSVRLLPLNDNFDDGVLNLDRWESNGTYPPIEMNGFMHQKSDGDGGTGAILKAPLPGDFTAVETYKNIKLSVFRQHPGADIGHYFNSSDESSFFFIYHTYSTTSKMDHLEANSYTNGIWGWSNVSPSNWIPGQFRLKREGASAFTDYWDGAKWVNYHSRSGMSIQPEKIKISTKNADNLPDESVQVDVDTFYTNKGTYANQGTVNLKHDSGISNNKWSKLLYSSTQPVETSFKFRTRTAETEAGLVTAIWSNYITASGSTISSPVARWIEVEATLSTTNTNVTPLLNDITVTYESNPGEILWQADVPVNLVQGALSDLNNTIGTFGATGKLYLQGTLTSTTGQTVAISENSFYIAQSNTLLVLYSDKKLYKPGEIITISGETKNLSTVDATNLLLAVKSKTLTGSEQTIYSGTYTIPAGGSTPFTVQTTAGAEGVVTLTGTVTQSNSLLTEMSDQYEVSSPQVTASVTAPDVAGNDPFPISLEFKNTGKTDAIITVTPSVTSLPETMTIPAGESRMSQYNPHITADTSYTFTITGDLTQTITKSVRYGLAGTLAINTQAMYPEGKITVPITISNTGLADGGYSIQYGLNQGTETLNQQTAGYYLPKGANSTDVLFFDLIEGTYQLIAQGTLPSVSASASFQVRKETKADMTLAVGAEAGENLPVTVNLTNLGYSQIEGSVRVSLVDSNGITTWNASQDVSLPQSLVPVPHSLLFSINLAAIKPSAYTIRAEFLNAANQLLALQTAPFTVLGPVFELTQIPSYQTFPAGGSASLTFKVKNSGNQEGNFTFSFKADDLIDSSRNEWLKPGEEKELIFNFTLPTDLEEKDYSATYRLKTGASTIKEGLLTYHLAGIKLAVTAALDRQNYNVGDTAILTLTITQQDSGAAPTLFARVNYNGFEDKKDFTLNGTQTLTFAVPLSQITGEKLFYGIYHQSGRSIHLNTTYIYPADDKLNITTDKQVYNPGETVSVTITGSAVGDLTLSGPGDFSNTFAFAGLATRSFALPSTMTAGTYPVNAQLIAADNTTVSAVHPIDVAGIQVKVKEALLDKIKYAATDTMALNLTIESNQDLPATLKTWVVDPANSYTDAGSGDVALTAAQPIMMTQNAALATASTGIHKLVYGIYKDNLLLASGAKAFDIGDAVLLGVSTDKTDYPEITLPVTVKADLYGLAYVAIEFFLDGASIKADTVSLTGFTGYTFAIPPASLVPGMHNLKAVLTTGGLASTKETSFTYGSSLPDLTVRVAAQPVSGTMVPLSVIVSNQGKTGAGACRATIWNGDPSIGGTLIATLDVPPLAAGASQTFSYSWNALGNAGQRLIYARADSDNSIVEFIEGNNLAFTVVNLPDVALQVTPTKSAYGANEEAEIVTTVANLTAAQIFENTILRIRLTAPDGLQIDIPDQAVASIPSATTATLSIKWNTGSSSPGSYGISARLVTGTAELAAATSVLIVQPSVSVVGTVIPDPAQIKQGLPLVATYTLANNGNVSASGVVRASLMKSGVVAVAAEQEISLPLSNAQTGNISLATENLSVESYTLQLDFISAGLSRTLASATVSILDGIAPLITITSPVVGAVYPVVVPITAVITDNASGVASAEYRLDNGAWDFLSLLDQTAGKYTAVWQPAIADNGTHKIEFRAADHAANSSAVIPVTFTVRLDTTPPVLTVSTLADGSFTNSGTLNVSGTVFDDNGLKELRVNGEPIGINVDGTFSHALVLQAGANTITVEAFDIANNRAVDTRTINLDQNAPKLTITAPADNSVTGKGFVDVTGAVDEKATVEIKARDTLQTVAMDGASFSATVPLQPGLNGIDIIATDLANNSSSQKRTVMYDNDKPSLAVTDPDHDITTNQSIVDIKGTVADALTAVNVSVSMGEQIFNPPVVNGSFEQNVSFQEEKQYNVFVTATDEAGNAVSVQRNIIYDKTGPILTIDPVTSPTTTASQLITGTRDAGITVTVACPTATVGGVAYPFDNRWQANVNGLHIGDNNVTASAFDAAGNSTTVSTVIKLLQQDTQLSITATPYLLWPPNKKLVPVVIGGGILSDSGDIQSVNITVTDEYGKINYSNLKFGASVLLEAWRDGTDNDGRIYTITAVATHKDGTKTSATTKVLVPHDMMN